MDGRKVRIQEMKSYAYIAEYDIYRFIITRNNLSKWRGEVIRNDKLVYWEQTNISLNKLKVRLLNMYDVSISTPYSRLSNVECRTNGNGEWYLYLDNDKIRRLSDIEAAMEIWG